MSSSFHAKYPSPVHSTDWLRMLLLLLLLLLLVISRGNDK